MTETSFSIRAERPDVRVNRPSFSDDIHFDPPPHAMYDDCSEGTSTVSKLARVRLARTRNNANQISLADDQSHPETWHQNNIAPRIVVLSLYMMRSGMVAH